MMSAKGQQVANETGAWCQWSRDFRSKTTKLAGAWLKWCAAGRCPTVDNSSTPLQNASVQNGSRPWRLLSSGIDCQSWPRHKRVLQVTFWQRYQNFAGVPSVVDFRHVPTANHRRRFAGSAVMFPLRKHWAAAAAGLVSYFGRRVTTDRVSHCQCVNPDRSQRAEFLISQDYSEGNLSLKPFCNISGFCWEDIINGILINFWSQVMFWEPFEPFQRRVNHCHRAMLIFVLSVQQFSALPYVSDTGLTWMKY